MENRKPGLLIFLAILLLTGCADQEEQKNITPKSKMGFLMGTLVQVSIYDEIDDEVGEEALSEAFGRIEELEAKLSSFLEGSEITRLNQYAGEDWVEVSPETFFILEKGKYYSELTAGLFDLTVGPLVKLWGIGTGEAKIPSAKALEEKINLVGFKELLLDETKRETKLARANMMVDLGGIAKGFAADETAKILRKYNITSAIINLGGDVLTLGGNTNGDPFKLGIQDPFGPIGEFIGVYFLEDASLVTSGSYERYFIEGGNYYHHLINPFSGYPGNNELVSVSVITKNSADGDALSTAAFLSGLEKGLELIKRVEHTEAIFITKDKKVYCTPGIKEFTIVKDEYRLVQQLQRW